MQTRSLPVLDDADTGLERRLAVGLGDDAARVLTYLVKRAAAETVPEPAATRPEIVIGTGLGRDATVSGTNVLADRGLVTDDRIRTPASEQPRKAWSARAESDAVVATVQNAHASALLEQARTVGAAAHFKDKTNSGQFRDTGNLTVALNWEANPVHFPILVAADRGAFADRGLDVSLTEHHGSGAAMAAVRSGRADAGIVGPATLVQSTVTDASVLPVALLYQRSMVVLYTTRDAFDGRFDSIEQLRGRRVAMATHSETALLARLFLSQADVLEDVTIEPIETEERHALLAGDADVAVGVVLDPLILEQDGHTVDTTLVAESFPLPGPAVVARRSAIEDHSGDLRDLLAGIQDGWTAGVVDPTTVRGALPDESADVAALTQRLTETFGTSDTVTANGWGWQTPAQWTRLRTALGEADLLE